MLVGIGFGWTGVGLLVAANGADDAWAGIATMYYGEQVHTLKYRALYAASDGNETVATIGEIGVGFASGAAVSKLNHLAKISKQAQQAGNVGEAVARTTDNAVGTLNSADNFAVSAASQSPVKRYGIGDQLPTIQCFAPDTLVDTPQGKRRIDEIRENDLVFAFDFTSGQWVERPVEVCHRNLYQGSLIEISTKHDTVVATAYHPFWVLEGYDLANRPRPRKLADTEDEGLALRGRWVNSHDLMAGDLIYSTEGRELRVLKIVQTYEEQFEVYNLTIAQNHSFAVGNDGVLVHNTGGCPTTGRQLDDSGMMKLVERFSDISQTNVAKANKYLSRVMNKGFINQSQFDLVSSISGMKLIKKGPGIQMHHFFPVAMGSRILRNPTSPYLYSAAAWEHTILHTALDNHFNNPAFAKMINGESRSLQYVQNYHGRTKVIKHWTRSERIAILDDFYRNFVNGRYLPDYLKEKLVTLAPGID